MTGIFQKEAEDEAPADKERRGLTDVLNVPSRTQWGKKDGSPFPTLNGCVGSSLIHCRFALAAPFSNFLCGLLLERDMKGTVG